MSFEGPYTRSRSITQFSTCHRSTSAQDELVLRELVRDQLTVMGWIAARGNPGNHGLGPDQFVVSLRHYRPAASELSRERLKAALSTAEGLLLQPRGEGELIELSDDEAVAAAVMLPMVAADRLAPSASSHTGGAFKRNVRGIV